MKKFINLEIDGKSITTLEGKNLIEVASENDFYIPTLCYFKGMDGCLGTCRVCTVEVNGRTMAACTLKAENKMSIKINTPELNDIRKGLIELLFVEGNHFCPGCEKSGDCDLQALGYQVEMVVPRFHYRFRHYDVNYEADNIVFEHNRCVYCKRCTHQFVDQDNHRVFSFKGKGNHIEVEMNIERANALTLQKIDEVVSLCPVGAILKKGKGFDRPIGSRKFDIYPISHKENK